LSITNFYEKTKLKSKMEVKNTSHDHHDLLNSQAKNDHKFDKLSADIKADTA